MTVSGLSSSQTTINHALQRDNNNFDLFRLIAALLVIYGHSYSTAPDPGRPQDFLFLLTDRYYSAAVAVKFFFFLSGLLVTDSLLKRKTVSHFLIARFFRIWPALAFVLIISALVIGPLATSLDLDSYFGRHSTYLYIKNQLLMKTWNMKGEGFSALPGVFSHNAYKSMVNASLWTLVAEVYAYLFLASAFLVGLFERRLATFLVGAIILDAMLPSRAIFTFLGQENTDYTYLPFCFASGAFFALYKEKICVRIGVPAGFCLLAFLLRGTAYEEPFFYLAIFTAIFYLATRPLIRTIRLPADVSYGVYLWGWPMQQVLAHAFPGVTGLAHCFLAMVAALLMGWVSWVAVEKRAIELGKRISRHDNLRMATTALLSMAVIFACYGITQKDDFSDVTTRLKGPAFGSVDVVNGVVSPQAGSAIPVGGETFEIAGNYVDAVNGEAAAGVIVLIDDTPFVTAYGGPRPDIAKALNNPKYLNSMFYAKIPTHSLGKGFHELKIRVVASDRSGYYESGLIAKLEFR